MIIESLSCILKEGKIKAEKIIADSLATNYLKEIIGLKDDINMDMPNLLYQGDNLNVLTSLIKDGYGGKIDLIYIDPPFLTKANYKGRIEILNENEKQIIEHFAYKDIWENGLKEYLEMICIRLYLMKDLLSEKGSIYVHLDYRTVHYVKIIMDYIFGEENFLNEIIWAYKSGGVSTKYFSRKHDTILVYSKTKNYIFNPQKEKSYNRGFKPYRFKGVEEFQDEIGWYTLVNLKDVWNIDIVGRTSKERVGYGTQKPEKLLERIILSSSNEGSIVADFFAGSGTTGIVAERNNRKWIMSDIGNISCLTINKRLSENKSLPYKFKKEYKSHKLNELIITEVRSEKLHENKSLLKIKLDKYNLDLSKVNLNKKHMKIVENILNKDSISLLDYIGIDLNYDGKTPVITWEDYRRTDYLKINPNIEIEVENNMECKLIYIKILDVFGHEYSEIIDI